MISNCDSVPNLGSSSVQQQAVRTEAVESAVGVYHEDNEEKKRLYLFVNNISVGIYFSFPDCRQPNGSDYIAQKNII